MPRPRVPPALAWRLLPAAAAPLAAFAHDGAVHPPTLATAWSLSPGLLVPAAAALALYLVGLARVWQRAGVGHGISGAAAAGFGAGCVALFLAAVWPLDALGEWSLAAHMGQHMLLLALVPPLLLAGQPVAAIAHALPRRWAGTLHRRIGRVYAAGATRLAAATAMQLAVMALWHLPAATAIALEHEPVHWAMHASFLGAGLWYWAAMLHRLRGVGTDGGAGAGAALVAVVVVMMQMGFVGALLTFSPRPLYAVYVERAPMVGLDALTDQQLAGLLMWVPASLPYLIGGLWLVSVWLGRIERRHPAPQGSQGPRRNAARPARRN